MKIVKLPKNSILLKCKDESFISSKRESSDMKLLTLGEVKKNSKERVRLIESTGIIMREKEIGKALQVQ